MTREQIDSSAALSTRRIWGISSWPAKPCSSSTSHACCGCLRQTRRISWGSRLRRFTTAWKCSNAQQRITPSLKFHTWRSAVRGPHYTIDTVKILAEAASKRGGHLLIGGGFLPRFSNVAHACRACRCRASNRGDETSRRPFDVNALAAQIPGLKEKVKFLRCAVWQELSSSELRERMTRGRMVRYYLLPSVYDYIEENLLYQKIT